MSEKNYLDSLKNKLSKVGRFVVNRVLTNNEYSDRSDRNLDVGV